MRSLSSKVIGSRAALVVLGVLTALVTLEVGMRAAGALLRFAQHRRNQDALGRAHQVRILCIGESTTAPSEHGDYPQILEELLNRQDLGVRFAVVNHGRIGATTNDLIADLDAALDKFAPNLIVVMMGINDGGKTQAWGALIAPGSDHWYGSFRLYKLYRLIRFGIERRLRLGEEAAAPAADLDPALPEGNDLAGDISSAPEQTQQRIHAAVAHIERGEYADAERILADVVRDHPELSKPYIELAQVYWQTKRPEQAHRLLLRAVETVPDPSLGLYGALAYSHYLNGDTESAVRTYRFLINSRIEPSHVWDQTYYRVALAEVLEETHQLDLAEQTLIEIADEVDPWNDIAQRWVIEFYERQGKPALAAQRREKQLRLQREYVNPHTKRNFQTLRAAAQARGIPLIAVQYPTREVETLKRMLDYDGGVIYVDNTFFKEVAESDGYETVFIDRFAGDFGHLNEMGNRLLARSVARAIVEEFFGKPFRDDDGVPQRAPH